MAPPQRLFPGDAELAKRDDDHRPAGRKSLGIAWQHRRIPHGPRRRTLQRVAYGIAALIVLYYFFKNMPTDLENPRQRPNYGLPAGTVVPPSKPSAHSSTSMPGQAVAEVSVHDFNGPIKFLHLAASLRAVSKTRGGELINDNVLFAAASVKSAGVLLPIACDMATRERNYVHFAFMGRDDVPMDILRAVNGVTDCKIVFHDARPDYSMQSTDFRMEVSSSAGFTHINTFVHPRATFIDASGVEEKWFFKGLRETATSIGRTVIELPDNVEQNLMWITLLDSASLSAWSKVSIDIIVHAQPSTSGSLMRLLESLKTADFFSSALPRLTIELPHDIDEVTTRYLRQFKWPPNARQNTASLLTLHHRIPQHGLTAEENSIRLLESFWPNDPLTSHVLIVSPQAELSPLFFHYLKYAILEYKYSTGKNDLKKNLLGISLDLPSAYLNDTTAFEAPLVNVAVGEKVASAGATPFLWQTPNSNAALYFGDKWVELHDLVARLLSSQHSLPTPTTLHKKEVSTRYPSWLEHILKLVRARGYLTIYPNFENWDSLVTLHNELYQPPEEYSQDTMSETAASGELTANPAHHIPHIHVEKPLLTSSLLSLLPLGGELPKLAEMPCLSWDGERIELSEIELRSASYSQVFRREIGGCGVDAPEKMRVDMLAGDLFCLDDPAEEVHETHRVENDGLERSDGIRPII